MIPFHNLFYFVITATILFLSSSPSSTAFTPLKHTKSSSSSSSSTYQTTPTTTMSTTTTTTTTVNNVSNNSKRLRRLPHVFNKVLELPFAADADVYVQEHSNYFEFVANGENLISGFGVKARVIEVYPGITKVVITKRDNINNDNDNDNGNGTLFLRNVDELEFDVWRFRLPSSARAELATAVYARGQLVVVVPKIGWGENNRKFGGCKGGGFKGNNMGNLVLVH